MNILMCCLFSDSDANVWGLKKGFEALGHRVITCCPKEGNYSEKLSSLCDIKVYDKPHPERYSYEEILEKTEKAGYAIDLILQRDSHFFLYGKPPEIPRVYRLVDIHRGGKVFLELAREGNFNYIFLAYKYYARLFQIYGLKTVWLPRGVDATRIKEYPEIEEQCDIAFCGTTGISSELLDFPCYDRELDRRYHEGTFSEVPPEKRYANWANHSLEYAERAELLIRLSKDFDVRIYEPKQEHYLDENYPKTICRGRIGFHRSLRKDLTVRNFEVLACNRLLITDEIPEIYDLFEDEVHLRIYGSYYQPQFANFDLDYKEVRNLVDYYLEHEDERREIAQQGRDLVVQKHTEKDRARQILETVFK